LKTTLGNNNLIPEEVK